MSFLGSITSNFVFGKKIVLYPNTQFSLTAKEFLKHFLQYSSTRKKVGMDVTSETTPALVLREEGELSDSEEKREEKEPIPVLKISRLSKVEHTSSRQIFQDIFHRLKGEGRLEDLPR